MCKVQRTFIILPCYPIPNLNAPSISLSLSLSLLSLTFGRIARERKKTYLHACTYRAYTHCLKCQGIIKKTCSCLLDPREFKGRGAQRRRRIEYTADSSMRTSWSKFGITPHHKKCPSPQCNVYGFEDIVTFWPNRKHCY